MLNNFKRLAIGFCCACALLGSGCSKDGGSAQKLQEGSPEAIAYAFEQALCAGDSQGALKQMSLEKQLGADQKDQIAMVQGKLGPGIEKLAKDVKAAGGVKEIKTESAVISRQNVRRAKGSMPLVGSSRKRIFGSWMRAAAIDKRCL